MTATALDPENIQPRLYRQLGALLADMETGDDTNLRQKVEAVLNDKRGTDATLRHRMIAALEADAGITTRERIAALTAIARVLMTFQTLRGDVNEPERGSAVRKYAAAFQQRPAAHAANRGKTNRRSAAARAAVAAAYDAGRVDAEADADDPAA